LQRIRTGLRVWGVRVDFDNRQRVEVGQGPVIRAPNLRRDWLHPWSGPTNKQLDAARERLKKGEKQSQVLDELLLQVLEKNVRLGEEQLANLTE
jgi:hypothetical protein